jgi:hypothetical protein
MTEALASKTCTPCRGAIPPLTREQAEFFHAQAPDWQLLEEAHRIERSFPSAIFERRLPLFRKLVNSRKLKAIIRTSASVGAVRRSRCKPRRSRDYMRTTSSWLPRSTAYSLARPRAERILLVLQLAPLFSVPAVFFDVQTAMRQRASWGAATRSPLMFDVFQAGGQPARLFARGE